MDLLRKIAQSALRSAEDVEVQGEAAAAVVVVAAVEVRTGRMVVAGKAVPAEPGSEADTQCTEAAEQEPDSSVAGHIQGSLFAGLVIDREIR
jgi:hypothetical protein